MNPVVKIVLYVALTAITLFCGRRFVASFSHSVDQGGIGGRSDRVAGAETLRGETTEPDVADAVNALTNGTAGPTNRARALIPTAGPARSSSLLGWYGAVGFGALLGLGLLAGRDISAYVSHRAHEAMFGESGEGIADPEYDRAEQVWADGDHLEAIRLMREFLQKNPRALHAGLRIAEIYEKDLNNPLAAALEYEELLKRRFEPERWGWSAIHLCNLHTRLGQADKTEALLRRIIAEVPETPAAAKARERLGLSEGGSDPVAAGDPAPAELDASAELPRGFKLRKG